jgi:hypothetical protein
LQCTDCEGRATRFSGSLLRLFPSR